MDLGYEATVEDAAEYKGGHVVLSPGWKTAQIKESVMKVTKANDGKYLELSFEVISSSVPEEIEEKVITRLNIHNKNDDAQKIGRATLGKIIELCGLSGVVKDSNQLHGMPIDIKVTVKEFESNVEPGKMLKSNEIKDYRKPQKAGISAASNGNGKQWF